MSKFANLVQPRAADYEAIKRNAFLDQDILIVSIHDKRLAWQDKEILKAIGERLYPKPPARR